jgi:HEAT repeat protein
LREFGQTPLLLWMLCGLFRQTGQIPANLGEVFRAFTQGYERNLKADVPVESDRRWWPELLQELAFWMMRGVPFGESVPAVDTEFRVAISRTEACRIFAAFLQNKEAQTKGVAQKYLDDLLRHHLIQSYGDKVEFRHQLLQEYYAAEYSLGHWDQISELEFKRDYLNYLKWTEAISLMVGLMDDESLILQVVNLALELDLMLGARLAREAKSESQLTTVEIFQQKVPEFLKCKLLANMRSNMEISRLLKALEHEDFDVRRSAADALGRIGSEQVISGLLRALEHEDFGVRRSAVDALGRIGSEQVISGLLKALDDDDSEVRGQVAAALGRIGSEQAILGLLKAVNGCMNEKQVSEFFNALFLENHEDSWRDNVSKAISEFSSESEMRGALDAFDEDYFVRLERIGSEQVILGLLETLEHNKSSAMRRSATHSLRRIGSDGAILGLLKALDDENYFVCGDAADALGYLGSEQAIPGLLKALEHDKSYVRGQAAAALGRIGSEQVILGLLKALEHDKSYVRWSAVEILENITSTTISHILPQLIALTPTPSGEEAFKAISTIQSKCKFYNYDLTQNTQSMKLFFSYAHKDEPLRDELAKHLSLLKRQNIITDWHDRNITAGTDWAQAIDDNLNTANIILLLISSDFLASDYCYDKEMTRALEHHTQGTARIIPIILRPCDWHSAPFGKLQALPKDARPVTQWADQDEAFLNIAQGIRKAVAELQQHKNIT